MSSVVSLHIAPAGGRPMETITSILAVAGRGLEGDRYFSELGTYSSHPGTGRQITLIESEAVEALDRDHRISIAPAQARRNVVTRGVALNHLVGRDFWVGEVCLRGARLCDPCFHLERLSAPGALRALVHRGGLRADILTGGTMRVGDAIVPVERAAR